MIHKPKRQLRVLISAWFRILVCSQDEMVFFVVNCKELVVVEKLNFDITTCILFLLVVVHCFDDVLQVRFVVISFYSESPLRQ